MTISGQPASQDSPAPSTPDPAPTIFSTYRKTQALVLIACLISVIMFWEGGGVLGIPPVPRYLGSLLAQQSPLTAVIATYLMFVAALILGTVIAGRNWFFAGLFTAAVGLMSLSVRGGPMRYVLFDAAANADTHRVFLRLLTEQCLIFIPIAFFWPFIWHRYDAVISTPPAPGDEEDSSKSSSLGPTLGAIIAQTLIMGLLVRFLSATDAKKQVVVSTFIGGFAGAALGEYLSPSRKAAGWYWLAPFLIGAFGYIMAYFNATDTTSGYARGALQNLAFPLPLDYAGAGIAGSLLGYWISEERPKARFSLRPPTQSPST